MYVVIKITSAIKILSRLQPVSRELPAPERPSAGSSHWPEGEVGGNSQESQDSSLSFTSVSVEQSTKTAKCPA